MTRSLGMWVAVAESNWWKSNRREELPPDWARIRQRVLRRCGFRCEHVSQGGIRCSGTATEVDHALGRNIHDDNALQGLCHEHHKRKTAEESRDAKRGKRRKGARRRRDDRPGAL